MDQACRKILAISLQLHEPLYTAMAWQEQRTGTQDTVTQNPTKVPNLVQDPQRLKDAT